MQGALRGRQVLPMPALLPGTQASPRDPQRCRLGVLCRSKQVQRVTGVPETQQCQHTGDRRQGPKGGEGTGRGSWVKVWPKSLAYSAPCRVSLGQNRSSLGTQFLLCAAAAKCQGPMISRDGCPEHLRRRLSSQGWVSLAMLPPLCDSQAMEVRERKGQGGAGRGAVGGQRSHQPDPKRPGRKKKPIHPSWSPGPTPVSSSCLPHPKPRSLQWQSTGLEQGDLIKAWTTHLLSGHLILGTT